MPYAAAPTDLRFEHRTEVGPVLGISTPTPRLSWIVADAAADYEQDAYEVEVTRDGGELETTTVDSADSVLVPWPGAPLRSRETATVRIRVRGGDDWSDWSEPAVVEAGPVEPGGLVRVVRQPGGGRRSRGAGAVAAGERRLPG